MTDSEWRDPFEDEEAARERERRRAEREARRRERRGRRSWRAKPEPPDGVAEDRAARQARPRERRELLAAQLRRRLVRARLAHPDPGRRRPLASRRAVVRRRRLAVLAALLVMLGLGAWGIAALADRLSGSEEEVPRAGGGKLPTLTIPEGYDRADIAALAREQGIRGDYEKATKAFRGFDPARYGAADPPSLEGFLFPATYELPRRPSVEDLVARQLDAFEQNFAGVGLGYAKSKNLTAYDVLIIASMIQGEVTVASEADRVAAVIYNRLAAGMPLQIDATVRYATGNFTEPLSTAELESDSPYNTYVNPDLPPTPISSPGLAAIEAAANPAGADYLYYVVKPGTCEHNFASTDAEFQRYKAEYDQARADAGGQSPTPEDCPG